MLLAIETIELYLKCDWYLYSILQWQRIASPLFLLMCIVFLNTKSIIITCDIQYTTYYYLNFELHKKNWRASNHYVDNILRNIPKL